MLFLRSIVPVLLGMLLICGCSPRSKAPSTHILDSTILQFDDVSESMGLRFRHINGADGRRFLPETMGSGCAFIDFDGDGRLDIILLSGKPWKGDVKNSTVKIFRNAGARFEDVTEQLGLHSSFYAMGVAVGDYDNDGHDDIFVSGVGECRLFHNEAGKRFRDVTSTSGVAHSGWSTSATWIDFDRDGRLDLFVCHYVKWSEQKDRFFSLDDARKTYATPESYEGESCRLFHNEGGGKFTDVTGSSGILQSNSKALGVVALDFDQDGWPDIVVANDTTPNFLFHNQGNQTFKEVGTETGVALGDTGKPKAGMGVDAIDENGAGHESIAITNFSGEQLTLYRSDGAGHYLDAAAASGIGTASRPYLGFGVVFLDVDGDGSADLIIANGHIQEDAPVRRNGEQYREPALLLRGRGDGTYTDVTSQTGKALPVPEVGRGAAWGDFDNDGRPDLLLTSNNGPARLLRNTTKSNNHWLRVELRGTKSNRNGYGARVRVKTAGRIQSRTVRGGSSYLSQSDPRPLFGLGAADRIESVEIAWPSGEVQVLGPTKVDQTLKVIEPNSR